MFACVSKTIWIKNQIKHFKTPNSRTATKSFKPDYDCAFYKSPLKPFHISYIRPSLAIFQEKVKFYA